MPHSFGQPVELNGPPQGPRIREWPNRLGILERGGPEDVVIWHQDLTSQEPNADDVRRLGDPIDAGTLADRTRWFRRLLKRLEQVPGVTTYVQPEAPCAVLLTPGIAADRLESVRASFADGIEALAEVLPEFPGGLQLRLTDLEWAQAEEYAGAIEELLREDH